MTHVTWTCRCGQTEAEIEAGPGDRLVCYCRDCQGFARHLGAAEILDAAGGVDLYNTLPDRLRMVKGAGRLKVLRMTPKGPYRWYAGCCGTPFVNGAPTRAIPFATVILNPKIDAASLGDVRFRVGLDGASGPVPKGAAGAGAFARSVIWRMLVARISGRHRQTPFFDAAGKPVAAPTLLTADERRAAVP